MADSSQSELPGLCFGVIVNVSFWVIKESRAILSLMGKLSVNERVESIEMLSLRNNRLSGVGLSPMVSTVFSCETVLFFLLFFVVFTFPFCGNRLKYCSNPMPLETMKLVAVERLTLITELSDSVCEL